MKCYARGCKRAAHFRCRECGKDACKHHCANKIENVATCSACRVRAAQRVGRIG